jgi:hypothetical protein
MSMKAGVKKYLESKTPPKKSLAQAVSSLIERDLQGVTTTGMDEAIKIVEGDFGRALTDSEKENGFGAEWPIVRFSDGSACDFSGEWSPKVIS